MTCKSGGIHALINIQNNTVFGLSIGLEFNTFQISVSKSVLCLKLSEFQSQAQPQH